MSRFSAGRWLCFALLSITPGAVAPASGAEPFEFAAMGCMPYFMPEDEERFARVIETVNRAAPAFAIHCGDTKYGRGPCDDAAYDQIKRRFDRFTVPLVYVPGDNEWTDCHEAVAGSFNPIERLALVRRLFFAEPHSLAVPSINLASQRTRPPFSMFVEHDRWEFNEVLFATLHVVGSNNNHRPEDPAAMAEFEERDRAAIAWMREAFAHAKERGHKALVLIMQANPFSETQRSEPRSTGFVNIVAALKEETQSFPRQVCLIHADSHYFRVDKPLTSAAGRMLENFTRIETFGGHNLHLVRVRVDPNAADPVQATPWRVEGNEVDPAKPLPAAAPKAKAKTKGTAKDGAS